MASYSGKVLRLNVDGTTPQDQPSGIPVFAADSCTRRGDSTGIRRQAGCGLLTPRAVTPTSFSAPCPPTARARRASASRCPPAPAPPVWPSIAARSSPGSRQPSDRRRRRPRAATPPPRLSRSLAPRTSRATAAGSERVVPRRVLEPRRHDLRGLGTSVVQTWPPLSANREPRTASSEPRTRYLLQVLDQQHLITFLVVDQLVDDLADDEHAEASGAQADLVALVSDGQDVGGISAGRAA